MTEKNAEIKKHKKWKRNMNFLGIGVWINGKKKHETRNMV
jgi:hypothetical protein